MPFESLAQEHYMHAHPEILGKNIHEWDAATKGKHLPEHVHHNEYSHAPYRAAYEANKDRS